MGGDVRTTVGVPKLSAFANGSGTPLVIDTATGVGYFTDKNTVVPITGGGITGPATTVVDHVPQWNSTTGSALKDGLPVQTGQEDKTANALLKVGAGGLLGLAPLALDANTIATTQWNHVIAGSANIPIASDGVLTTVAVSANSASQNYQALASEQVFVRSKFASVWEPWQELTGGNPVQTWQDVTASRALGTVYTNSTGQPIDVAVTCDVTGGDGSVNFSVGPLIVTAGFGTVNVSSAVTYARVPAGATYRADGAFGTVALSRWAELR